MASGHGVEKPDKGNHPKRKVGRGGPWDASLMSNKPEEEMNDDEWLRHMMGKYGPGPEGAR